MLREQMNTWQLIYRFSWSLLAVLCIIGLIAVFTPRCRSLGRLRETKRTMEEENAKLVTDIKDLRIRQERFTTEPAYVERTAREIGMVKPGETVYMFTNQSGQAISLQETP